MAVLKIEQVEKTKDGTSSLSMTIYMVKEGGQWKAGKPEGAKQLRFGLYNLEMY